MRRKTSDQRSGLVEKSQNPEHPTALEMSLAIYYFYMEYSKRSPLPGSALSHTKGLDRVSGRPACLVIFPRGNPSLRLATRS